MIEILDSAGLASFAAGCFSLRISRTLNDSLVVVVLVDVDSLSGS